MKDEPRLPTGFVAAMFVMSGCGGESSKGGGPGGQAGTNQGGNGGQPTAEQMRPNSATGAAPQRESVAPGTRVLSGR
jgi:hypothetical protein